MSAATARPPAPLREIVRRHVEGDLDGQLLVDFIRRGLDTPDPSILTALSLACETHANALLTLFQLSDRLDGLLKEFVDYVLEESMAAYFPLRAARLRRTLELRAMPYREYLQTQEWQEKRQKKRALCGGHCQVCNATGPILDVHHRTYQRRGDEEMDDLLLLCRTCHALFHEQERLAREPEEEQP